MENLETSVFADARQHIPVAGTGLRFANYLIDMALFYGIFFAGMFLIGYLTVLMGGEAEALVAFIDTPLGKLCMYASVFSVLVIVYTLIEGATKGRSVGKLITGTVALRVDGSSISWKDAFMRSLCRCIPFEALSGIGGYPWHDKMTKTMVVKRQSIM